MGYLEASGLGYTLPDGRRLLRDVSLRAGAGQVVAVVGENGVGKSTVFDCACFAARGPQPLDGLARSGR